MIRDLRTAAANAGKTSTDVLVIGGGIAGLLIATRLKRAGRRVLVAESGGRVQTGEVHPFNRVEQRGDPYRGAEHGRSRCLGGTSTRWGGAMLPFQASDLMLGTRPDSPRWPIALEDWTCFQAEVEAMFGLGSDGYDLPDLLRSETAVEPEFIGRLAKRPALRLRNLATLLIGQLEVPEGPEVWLNAVATGFTFDPAGRLATVQLRSDNGRTLEVSARETVVAAGAIESTRLLLLADRQNDDRIFAPDAVLGRYFFDHLSLAAATIIDCERRAMNRLAGWRFEANLMRSLRFEPSAALRQSRQLPPAFVHIDCFSEKPGGFLVLREMQRKLQRRERPGLKDARGLMLALPWLTRAVWWWAVEKRLLFADHGELVVTMVIEQEPLANNRIGLSATECDIFGLPLAAIDWRVGERDAAAVVSMTREFKRAWDSGPLAPLGQLRVKLPEDVRGSLGSGVYHPGGSIRMGVSAADGVVDRDLQTFRVPNLTVVATATFPTGGGANPTMMLMMAALRAADRLAKQAGR
jgi:choline dehydrogenase-like flavoprotein